MRQGFTVVLFCSFFIFVHHIYCVACFVWLTWHVLSCAFGLPSPQRSAEFISVRQAHHVSKQKNYFILSK